MDFINDSESILYVLAIFMLAMSVVGSIKSKWISVRLYPYQRLLLAVLGIVAVLLVRLPVVNPVKGPSVDSSRANDLLGAWAQFSSKCQSEISEFESMHPSVPGLERPYAVFPVSRTKKDLRESIYETVRLPEEPFFRAFVAPPGSGKTTAVRAVFSEICKAFTSQSDRSNIILWLDARRDFLKENEESWPDNEMAYIPTLAEHYGSRITIIIDSYDELWALREEKARKLIKWARDLVDEDPWTSVLLVSRPYAIDLAIKHDHLEFGSIYRFGANSQKYRDAALRRLIFDRFGHQGEFGFRPEEQLCTSNFRDQLKQFDCEVNALRTRIESHFGERAFTIRDLRIISDSIYRGDFSAESKVGSLYLKFLEHRVAANIRSIAKDVVSIPAPLDLIECAAVGWLKKDKKVVHKLCVDEAEPFLGAAGLWLETVETPSVTLDVVRAYALRMLGCDVMRNIEATIDPLVVDIARTMDKPEHARCEELDKPRRQSMTISVQ